MRIIYPQDTAVWPGKGFDEVAVEHLLGAEHRVRKKRIALKTADEFTTVFVDTDILDHV